MTPDGFRERYGPAALVLGGSEGIGRSFADAFAAAGIDLILVARTKSKLDAAAAEIRDRHAVEVATHPLDLEDPAAPEAIRVLCSSREVGMIIYNAGATHGIGRFLDQPVELANNLVRLNCLGPIAAAHAGLAPMVERGRGGLILMSSMSALAGGGYIATYAATKAFDILFAEGLHWELRDSGVDILCAVAGLTDTPAMARSGMMARATAGSAMSPAEVVSGALAALGQTPVWYAPGEAAVAAMQAMPRAALTDMMTRATMALGGIEG